MVAITILVIYYWIQWPDPSPAGMVVYRALTVLNGWCWLMAIFGFARKYLNFSNGFLKYANEAVYPFYILHQTIIICIAYYMINWQMSIALKFFIISSSMFLLTLFLYECIIRRVNFLRVLFGLKWKAKSKNKAISASGSTQLV
jgi:peptidoglycan/LPS O-acetylase OafA/YrhL